MANVLFFPSGVNLRIGITFRANEEIARTIKAQYSKALIPDGKGALLSIGREFEDRAGCRPTRKRLPAASRPSRTDRRCSAQMAKRALLSVRCEFEDRVAVRSDAKRLPATIKGQAWPLGR